MKKFIAVSLLFLTYTIFNWKTCRVTSVQADTYTTGIPVLVLPSTNTVDKNKSWGDKLSDNFKAISTTISTVNNRLNTTSDTLNAAILVLRSQHDNIISTNIVNNTITEHDISSGASPTFGTVIASSITVTTGPITGGIFRGNGAELSNTVKVGSASVFIGMSSTINFVAGANIGLSVTNFSSNVTVNIYGGGSGSGEAGPDLNTTTFTKTIASGGPVYIASAVFNSIPGKGFSVGKTTYNVFEMRAYFAGKKSTVTAGTQHTYCRIAESTVPQQGVADNYWAFRYVSPIIEITTQSAYSLWYTTAFPLYPQNQYTLHITSIPSNGELPEDLKVEMNYWRLGQ